jgi:hypothetical protein
MQACGVNTTLFDRLLGAEYMESIPIPEEIRKWDVPDRIKMEFVAPAAVLSVFATVESTAVETCSADA